MNAFDTLHFFSELVKENLAFKLQGHYGRTASALIDDGWLSSNGEVNHVKIEENGIEANSQDDTL